MFIDLQRELFITDRELGERKGNQVHCPRRICLWKFEFAVRYGVWVELRFLDLRLGMGFGDGQPWIRRESLGRK